MVSAVTPNYRGEPEQEALLHLTRLFSPKERGWPRETKGAMRPIMNISNSAYVAWKICRRLLDWAINMGHVPHM